MSNRAKPLSLIKGHHISKEEREKRQKAEQKLKGKTEDILKVPSFLDKDAKQVYKRTLKLIGPEGTNILSDADKDSLTTYAMAVSILKQCAAEIKQNGLIIDGKPNPAVKMFENYSKIVKSFSSAFGLDPFSRSKLAITVDKEEKISVDSVLQSVEGLFDD
jgi:P27 family predicted phage terminase small subunit